MLAKAKKSLNQSFKTFDTDNSGYMEKHELGHLLQKLTEHFSAQPPSESDIG